MKKKMTVQGKSKTNLKKNLASTSQKKSRPAALPQLEDHRSAPRVPTPQLWVTERNGDFEYHLKAVNLSMGGVFLTGRAKGSSQPSELNLSLPTGNLTIKAQAIYDQVSSQGIGVGFKFVNLDSKQRNVLKTYLRNFN